MTDLMTPDITSITRSATFQAQFRNLELLRQFVGQVAEQCGMPQRSVYAVQLAVDEAFTNIIEHALGGECDESIDCTCQVTPRDLTITLHDNGHSFNPLDIPLPNLHDGLEDRGTGGLGLFLMRNLMDEIYFAGNGDPSAPNTLVMVKHRQHPH